MSGALVRLGEAFSKCDTRWPTEDSKYIFYDPGRLSPVTFSRREVGQWRRANPILVIWILFGRETTSTAMELGRGRPWIGMGVVQVSGGSRGGGGCPHLVLKSKVPHGVGMSVLRFVPLPGGAWTLTVCPSPISSSSPRAGDGACSNKVALAWREGSTTLFFSLKVGWYFGEFLGTECHCNFRSGVSRGLQSSQSRSGSPRGGWKRWRPPGTLPSLRSRGVSVYVC